MAVLPAIIGSEGLSLVVATSGFVRSWRDEEQRCRSWQQCEQARRPRLDCFSISVIDTISQH